MRSLYKIDICLLYYKITTLLYLMNQLINLIKLNYIDWEEYGLFNLKIH